MYLGVNRLARGRLVVAGATARPYLLMTGEDSAGLSENGTNGKQGQSALGRL